MNLAAFLLGAISGALAVLGLFIVRQARAEHRRKFQTTTQFMDECDRAECPACVATSLRDYAALEGWR